MKRKRTIAALVAGVFLTTLMSFSATKVNAATTKESTTTTESTTGGINWMNGTKYFPLGANYAWKDWGNDFSDNGWDYRFTQIKADFDDMKSKGVNAVRWWVFCDSWAAPLFSDAKGGLCTGLPDKWVDHMEEAANYANSKNMKIYFTFTSFDVARTTNNFYHGNIIDDLKVRKSFIDNAVTPIVKQLGTNPGIMGWDVVNEPEWMISDTDGGAPNKELTTFSLSTLRSFVKDMVDCIHQYAKQPVSVGSASLKWLGEQYDFWSGLNLDFYDFHWYDWATPWFNPLKTSVDQLKVKLGKPVILGEVMPDMQNSSVKESHQQVLEQLAKNGYSGYMLWSWTDSKINCQNATAPDFANFTKAHPELNIDKTDNTLACDVNGDGVVNVLDVIALKKYLADSSFKINTVNADINNDGNINVLDLILLKRSLGK
ncbi:MULTISPECIES: dockerin type I domain-containing protein [Clostridium]|uniref:dockerin type I domain-containing protein n=1 Tax=Clostridium TaxID=1485 RepID=UPI000826600F|nr:MULTISPECIES: dockerin type I domain-containing protein [Clostridium]PJI07418.1 endoglucanase [Clostridium sp. CT7]